MSGAWIEPIEVRARDGAPLAATLFAPRGEPVATVLVAGAMGVRRGFYAPLATFLAEHGLAALTLDYRGIGDSKLDGDARLADWAELDLGGAADALCARYPRCRLLWLGHSLGGQLLGLVPEVDVTRAVFVASQSGNPEHWDGLARVGMDALWHLGVPLLTRATGKLPMRVFGAGEDVPAGVAEDWATWGRTPGYVAHHLRETRGTETFDYAGGLLAYAFTDDGYAPVRAVRALLALYPHARASLRVVSPEDLGVRSIGHFGALRPRFRDSWWTDALAFLLWGTTDARARVATPLVTDHAA